MNRPFASALGVMLLLGLLASPLTAQVKPPVTSHDLAGKENCLMCHTPGAMPAVPDTPENHKDRTVQSCQWCHSATSPLQVNPEPNATSHDLVGKDNCLMCHAAGVMPPVPDAPESHKDLPNESCLICHKPSGG
jgi:hypothetical protein